MCEHQGHPAHRHGPDHGPDQAPDHRHGPAHDHVHDDALALEAHGHALRVAVVGKGGVGKTTIAGALARALAARGLRLLAIDADPDANLASALPMDGPGLPRPLAQRPDALRAAAATGALPGPVLLNADTGTLLPEGTATWSGGQPLVMLGWSKAGGEGCYCAEHAVLRRLLSQAASLAAEVTLIDCEAGLEHLSRGTIAGIELVLVVVEPGRRSVETAAAVRRLARDLDIAEVHAVVTNFRDADELALVATWLEDWPPVAAFPHDEAVRSADLAGVSPQPGETFGAAADRLADFVVEQARTHARSHRHPSPASARPPEASSAPGDHR